VGRNGPQVGTPAHMRALNQRLVLDRLREHGEATRPRIAAGTGMSKPTVGQALLYLEQHGLVRTTGRSLSGPGRAAVVYQAAPDAGHVVGVDIGRRAIRIAVADLEGSIVARLDEPNRCRSASALVRVVSESVERAVSSAGLSPHEVVSTVVGTPGVPDPATGTVHRAPNLPDGAAGEIADLPFGPRPSGAGARRPGPMETVAAGQAVVDAARSRGWRRPARRRTCSRWPARATSGLSARSKRRRRSRRTWSRR